MNLSYSVLRHEASLEALRPEWDDLISRAVAPMPFLRCSWARLCWERQRSDRSHQLLIVTVRDGERLVLVASFVARRFRFFFRTLTLLDSLTPQYNDVLVEASDKAPQYVAFLWNTLLGAVRVRQLRLIGIREGSLLAPHLAASPGKQRETEEALFIDLAKFGSWDAYLRSLSGKLQSDHRRCLRNLQKVGRVEFRRATAATLPRDAAWLFAAKRDWIERKQHAAWLSAAGTEELFTAAAADGLASGRTYLTVLSVEEKIIAAKLGFREQATLYMSKVSYDPSWHACSPARTLTLLTIKLAFEGGLTTCDMMIGAGEWKQRLATGSIKVLNKKVEFRGVW